MNSCRSLCDFSEQVWLVALLEILLYVLIKMFILLCVVFTISSDAV